MKTEKYSCNICSEEWDDYYDAVSHVYTNHHPEDTCATPPGIHVNRVVKE